MRYNVGYVFLNKYDATKNHPWGGKCGIISKLQKDINIPDGTRSLMIHGITKEELSAKADGVKSEPNMKGWSKTGRKSIIDMGSKEAQIIVDAVELGMSTLNSRSIVNYHREAEELPSVCISAVETCIAKIKPIFVKVKNEKRMSLVRNTPTCKERFYGA